MHIDNEIEIIGKRRKRYKMQPHSETSSFVMIQIMISDTLRTANVDLNCAVMV